MLHEYTFPGVCYSLLHSRSHGDVCTEFDGLICLNILRAVMGNSDSKPDSSICMFDDMVRNTLFRANLASPVKEAYSTQEWRPSSCTPILEHVQCSVKVRYLQFEI